MRFIKSYIVSNQEQKVKANQQANIVAIAMEE